MQVGDRACLELPFWEDIWGFDAVEDDRILIQPNVEDGEEKSTTLLQTSTPYYYG
jgi:hypothetical protein